MNVGEARPPWFFFFYERMYIVNRLCALRIVLSAKYYYYYYYYHYVRTCSFKKYDTASVDLALRKAACSSALFSSSQLKGYLGGLESPNAVHPALPKNKHLSNVAFATNPMFV